MQDTQKFAKLVDLERNLREILEGLFRHKRWKPEQIPQSGEESVQEHLLKTSIVMQIMIAIEDYYGNRFNLDYFRLLQCAVNHDIGEAKHGDVLIFDKTQANKEEEAAAYAAYLDNMIPEPIRCFFPKPIDEQDNPHPEMKDFWHAAEIIGYVIFGKEELRLGYDNFNEQVIDRHPKSLKPYLRFPSVRIFQELLYGTSE